MADAHPRRRRSVFIVCADEKLTAFLELEATVARFAAKLPLTGVQIFSKLNVAKRI